MIFFVILRVNKFIFFQPSFVVLHSYYEWNNNTILPLNDNCISFEMWWIFFQFNPLCRVILRNITFVFDEILKKISISFVFIQTRRQMTNVFSLHDYHHTSNQSPFPTMTLLSTSFFSTFHLLILWAVNHFHHWSHHCHFEEPSNE